MLVKESSFGVRVTGLTETTTKEHLRACFSQVGRIQGEIKLSKRGEKIEGHVFYTTSQAMRKACKTLHEREINDKRISVTLLVSQPKELCDLFVSGHPGGASNEELRAIFSDICNIDWIRITNKGKYCFLQVYGRELSERAVKTLNGAVTKHGHKLSCEFSRKKPPQNTKNLQLSIILNQIATASHILPALSDQDMYILERSLRTFHLSHVDPETEESTVQTYFEQYGTVESCAIIYKKTYNTAYGFVVFENHRTSDSFRSQGVTSIELDNKMVKVSSSKPTKPVIETAQAAGLMNYEKLPTQLLYTLLSSALDVYEKPTSVYFQDSTTGQMFCWTTTERAYNEYLAQQITSESRQYCKYEQTRLQLEQQLQSYAFGAGTVAKPRQPANPPKPLAAQHSNRQQRPVYGRTCSQQTPYPKYSPY